MEDARLLALLAAVAATVVHVLLVGALLRRSRQRHAAPIMAAVAVAVFTACCILLGARLALWHFVAFFGAGVVVTLFLYGAVLKSLSLEMLAEMREGTDASRSLDDMTRRVVEPAFRARAEALLSHGLAKRDGESYSATSEGHAAAGHIARARGRLGIATRGLYGS